MHTCAAPHSGHPETQAEVNRTVAYILYCDWLCHVVQAVVLLSNKCRKGWSFISGQTMQVRPFACLSSKIRLTQQLKCLLVCVQRHCVLCQRHTVFAADMIAMSERMLTGAVKVSDSRATRQTIAKVETKAVLILDISANTEVRIKRGLCQLV